MEFYGDYLEDSTLSDHLTMTNMVFEMGSKNSVCKPDQKVFDHLKDRAKKDWEVVWADDDAEYVRELTYDLADIEPAVALPGRVDNWAPVTEIEGKAIDQAFIGSCTNGRIQDLREAASIIRGKHVAVRTIVQPASVEIYREAIKEGLIEDFLAAGCVVNHPGCGPCVGVCGGIIADNEVCVSTANRNFTGRTGSRTSELILASPLTAAASAVAGCITDPRIYFREEA